MEQNKKSENCVHKEKCQKEYGENLSWACKHCDALATLRVYKTAKMIELHDANIVIYKLHAFGKDGYNVKSLEVAIGEFDIAHIRLISNGKPDTHVQTITYSGRYTVWWE